MNSFTSIDITSLNQPTGSFSVEPERDEYSHLHFDRTTRSWWGHPGDEVVAVQAAPNHTIELACL